jgi:TonB family protein
VIIEDSSAEPDDGVTILHAHGRMDPAAVEAGIEPHGTELGACYTSRVGRRRWLGGHVVIHWDIKQDGTVTNVRLSESDLGAWPVEKCLLDVARSATFAKPIGGDAEFTLPLDFSARGGAEVWDEDQGLRAVGGQLAKLDACAKHGQPDDVTITLYVGPHGKAKSVGFSSSSSDIADDWAECAEKAALGWRLPDPRGRIAKLAVVYRAR